jgi:hypothetical protein
MSTVVFDRGRPPARNASHGNGTPHQPFQVTTTSTPAQQKSNILSTRVFPTPSNVPGLQSRSSGPPILPTTMTQQRRRRQRFPKSTTSFLCRWLPPTCQNTCFSIVGPLLSFLGTSIVIPPAILLKPEKAYTYLCTNPFQPSNPQLPSSPCPSGQDTISPTDDDETTFYNSLTELMEMCKAVRVDLAELRNSRQSVVPAHPLSSVPIDVISLLPSDSVEILATSKSNLTLWSYQLSNFQAYNHQDPFLSAPEQPEQPCLLLPNARLPGVPMAPIALRPPPEPPPIVMALQQVLKLSCPPMLLRILVFVSWFFLRGFLTDTCYNQSMHS